MRMSAAGAILLMLALTSLVDRGEATAAAQRGGTPDCVTIGKPRPTATYVYQHTEPGGRATRVSNTWESFTDTGSRLRADGPNGVFVQVNVHHAEDDVLVLDKSSKLGPGDSPIDTTTFRPGIVTDPAFRACAGRSWEIRPVTATYQSGQMNTSAQTPAGTLRIVAVRERITSPAGTFDTVHYVRTSQASDEYWKSIEHGVVVKHVATLPVGTVSETLLEIR